MEARRTGLVSFVIAAVNAPPAGLFRMSPGSSLLTEELPGFWCAVLTAVVVYSAFNSEREAAMAIDNTEHSSTADSTVVDEVVVRIGVGVSSCSSLQGQNLDVKHSVLVQVLHHADGELKVPAMSCTQAQTTCAHMKRD